MDEILIEEKKYVSSKRAAKMTGYAKDYVGQLCREGRVPARLVGRSWYVLESAIQDHRFGEPEAKREKLTKPTVQPGWESPRYEATKTEILPSVNRLRDTEVPTQADESPQLQDSWRAWFDRFDHIEGAEKAKETEPDTPEVATDADPEPIKKEEPEEVEQQKEINIPIRAIHHPAYQPSIEEFIPRSPIQTGPSKEPERSMHTEKQEKRKAVGRAMQMVGVFVAVIMAGMAILGTGYFDTYIISVSQARIFAGVSLYNK